VDYDFIGDGIRQITGYGPEEFTEDHWDSLTQERVLLDELAQYSFNEATQKVRSGVHPVWKCNHRIRAKDGSTHWVFEAAVELRDQNGISHGSIGMFQDITERKRVEDEREKLIAELERRNAELERFTYTVSHDLKSPLVTINGFMGYLEADAASGNMERFKLDRQRIQGAVDKMRALLDDLLELSRIGRLMNQPENIPFDEMVREAREMVHGQIEARNVTVLTQPGLPIVHGDRQRLIEILQNLIDNAIKYMGDQTNPIIEIGQSGEEDGKLVFFIRDNGIGIAPEYHERIFGLFNKLDSKSEGTGVGLALVKRIVEFHGGRIWVEGEVGNGSTFYFTLPRG
jgi:PAS domain S-box-containing protein